MAERRATPYTVAMILLLRRAAEREARRHLEAARALLEGSRRREAQAGQRLLEAGQRLERALGRPLPSGMRGQHLAQHQALLTRLREAAGQAAAAHTEAQRQVSALVREAERTRELLLLAIARREAAELHESSDRRDRARQRARRAARLEEELAGRRR